MAPALAADGCAHTIEADYLASSFVYRIDGHALRKGEDLLLALSRTHGSDSESPSTCLLVHERARLSDVTNLVGLMIKAGYAEYKIYMFDSQKRQMTELRLLPPIAFASPKDR
jgi:hypothetical protein